MLFYRLRFAVAIILLGIATSCSLEKKMIGEWQWVSYDLNDSLKTATPEEKVREFEELNKTDLIQSSIKNTHISFNENGIYEYNFGGTIKGGAYSFSKKNKVHVPHGILKSKKADNYHIKDISSEKMVLENHRHIFVFSKVVDEELEQNKKLPTADFTGTWTNTKTRGGYDNYCTMTITQKGDDIIGTMKIENFKGNGKGMRRYRPMDFSGKITGNIARITTKEFMSGQSTYKYTVYHVEMERTSTGVNWNFNEIRYEDGLGKPVYIQRAISTPFPRSGKFLPVKN
jgi:hypothetical protein